MKFLLFPFYLMYAVVKGMFYLLAAIVEGIALAALKSKKPRKKQLTKKNKTKPVQIEAKQSPILHFPVGSYNSAPNRMVCEVVILRKRQIQSAAKTYQIFLDGTPVGKLPNGGTVRFNVSPGNHKIAFKGYIRIEEFLDISVGSQERIKRLYASMSLKTSKIVVEDATGPEYNSIFSAQKPVAHQVPVRQSPPQKTTRQSGQRSITMARIDKMEGHDFEHFTAGLLIKLGYTQVKVTPGSGDQGVDVTATKDGKKYAIQCKRYSQKLGNKAVQEVFAGKTMYGCNIAVVLTNNYFTDGAKELARSTGVELWDRDILRRMIDRANYKAIV